MKKESLYFQLPALQRSMLAHWDCPSDQRAVTIH